MTEIPEILPPLPEIPRGKLWTSLALPPVVTCFGTIITGLIVGSRSNYGTEFLLVLPLGLLAIIVGLLIFIPAWRVRYRGSSLVLTSIGFFLGQVILCLALWFGSCLLVLRQ